MLVYVLFGGMIATTWVQIIKACLLLGGVTALLLIGLARFDFNPGNLYGAVADGTATRPSARAGSSRARSTRSLSASRSCSASSVFRTS